MNLSPVDLLGTQSVSVQGARATEVQIAKYMSWLQNEEKAMQDIRRSKSI